MAGWYELRSNSAGHFSFVLKAANGQVILTSEVYQAKASAQNGIASVQTNGPMAERYEHLAAKDGRPYFNLKAANHQVIGTSQMYAEESGRDNGIASVKANAATTDIREV